MDYNHVTAAGLILCWRRIRKFDKNKQTDREHTENSKPEATLIPADRRGERANMRDDARIYTCIVHYRIREYPKIVFYIKV